MCAAFLSSVMATCAKGPQFCHRFCSLVVLEGGLSLEALPARLAAEVFLLAVAQLVVAQCCPAAQALSAHVALGLQLTLAALHVTHVTHLACEFLVAVVASVETDLGVAAQMLLHLFQL